MVALTSCSCVYWLFHVTQRRAGNWDDDEYDRTEYDENGKPLELDYLDYVFVGHNFKGDSKDIRCATTA